MHHLIENRREQITALCQRYGVRRLEVFGSAAGDEFDLADSDVDLMVEFIDSKPEGAADRYFGLLEDLQRAFDRPVDLVVRNAVRNPYFLQTANLQCQSLYAA